MIGQLKKKLHEHQTKKDLLAFLVEIEKNLEIFYVADQRQFITREFLSESYKTVKDQPTVRKHERIMAYANAVEVFNRSWQEHKEYEKWYASDIKNKNPENARKLHALKNGVDAQLKAMEGFIIPAGQDLERELLNLGWLKYEQ